MYKRLFITTFLFLFVFSFGLNAIASGETATAISPNSIRIDFSTTSERVDIYQSYSVGGSYGFLIKTEMYGDPGYGSFTVTGLSPSTTYSFYVEYSGVLKSSVLTATTLATPTDCTVPMTSNITATGYIYDDAMEQYPVVMFTANPSGTTSFLWHAGVNYNITWNTVAGYTKPADMHGLTCPRTYVSGTYILTPSSLSLSADPPSLTLPINSSGTSKIATISSNVSSIRYDTFPPPGVIADVDPETKILTVTTTLTSTPGAVVVIATGHKPDGSIFYNPDGTLPSTSVPLTIQSTTGICSTPRFSCLPGTVANTATNGAVSTWNCMGTNGGGNASCSEIMSGFLSLIPFNCTIPSGGKSCTTNINWGVTNPQATSDVTSDKDNNGILSFNFKVFTGINANYTTVTLPHGPVSGPSDSRNFYLYNNTNLLAQATGTATCVSGTEWNGSICTPIVTPINGLCSLTHYSCAAGTSGTNGYYYNGTSSIYSWNCVGSNGGTTASCSETKIMSGTCSLVPPSCTIASGSGSCATNITWTTTNPQATSAITSNKNNSGASAPNTTVFTGNANYTTVTIPYPSRNFYLYNNGSLLSSCSGSATSSCISGTYWNGSQCVSNPTGTWSYPSSCPTACGTAASTQTQTCTGGNGACSGSPSTRTCGATAACPTGTWSYPSPCPTACGTVASTQTQTCTGGNGICSGSASTRTCGATAACLGPSVLITPNPGTVPYGGSSTLTWSSANVTSCTANGNWSGAKPTSGSYSTGSLTSSKSYGISCTGPYGSASSGTGVSVGAPPIVCISPQVLNGDKTGCYTPLTCKLPLVLNASHSACINPPPPGSTDCFDKCVGTTFYGDGYYNETSKKCVYDTRVTRSLDCGYVPPAMSGSMSSIFGGISSSSCVITSGSNSCNVTLSWSTINPQGTSAITSSYPSAGTTVATGNSGSQSVSIPYSSRNFYLYNNGQLLGQSTITSSCVSGTAWDGSKCAVIVFSPTATITATPNSIASGDSSTLTWSSTNAASCAGTNFNTGGATSGNITVSPTVTTTYSIVCTGPGGQAPDQATVTVTVTGKKPIFKEN